MCKVTSIYGVLSVKDGVL
jgi:hypothetical protein